MTTPFTTIGDTDAAHCEGDACALPTAADTVGSNRGPVDETQLIPREGPRP